MSTKAAVCVPWRPGDPSRERLWDFARARWENAGFPVFTGDNPEERFSPAGARNAAVAAAGDWDVALITDADVILAEPARAIEALADAAIHRTYVAAYTSLNWLLADATDAVLAGADPRAVEVGGSAVAWLNCFAISRDLWDRIGGFDPVRFPGTGGEDVSFFDVAISVGAQPLRVPGSAYHLYHTPREALYT